MSQKKVDQYKARKNGHSKEQMTGWKELWA